jgi:preprotein translocase subunit SecF
MEILIISSLSIVLIFLSFIMGLHYGSKIKSGEIIEVPNPIKKVKEHKQIKKIEKKLDKEALIEEINLANIDSYNGTELGQQNFPEE